MRRLGVMFCLMAACTTSAQTPGPAGPTGAAAAQKGEPAQSVPATAAPATATPATVDDDVTRYDGKERCEPARGMVQVDFPRGYSLIELVTWYMDVTCKMVLVPRVVLERRTARAVSERVDVTGAYELFQTLLGHLRLSDMGDNEVIVISESDGYTATLPSLGVMPDRPPRPRLRNRPDRAAEPRTDHVSELDASIRKIDETHYVIGKDLVEQVVANPVQYSQKVRFVPAVKDGKATGFKLFALRPNSLLGKLGFRNGDTMNAINGTSISTPDKALEVFSTLRDARRIEIELTRRGKPVRLVIDVVDAE